jgi:DNA-binding transcriptional MocR family regulator
MFGAAIVPVRQDGHHMWLPMSRQDAERCNLAARTLGMIVTPPASTAADPVTDSSGIRLCIGAPILAELSKGLSAVSGILAQGHA